MKKKTKFIIAGTSVAVIAATVGCSIMLTSAKNAEEMPAVPNTVSVEKMDLSKKVTLSGSVKSAETSTVKCALSGVNVKSVKVKVGDEVKKGDVIAVLDDSDLTEKLADTKKAFDNSKVKNDIDSSAADRNFESTISASDRSIKDAEDAIKEAQKTYDEAVKEKDKIQKEYNEALEEKNKAYNKYKPYEKYKDDDSAENKSRKKEREEKEEAYNEACKKLEQLETEQTMAAEALAQADAAVKTANANVEAARGELNKQIALRSSALATLGQAAAAPAEGAEAGAAMEDPETLAAAATAISSYDTSVSAAEKVVRENEAILKEVKSAYDKASNAYNKVAKDYNKALDSKNSAYDKYKKLLNNDQSEEALEYEQKYNAAKEKFELKEKELKTANDALDKARDLLNKQKQLKTDAETSAVKTRADLEGTHKTTELTVSEGNETQEKSIKSIEEDIEKCVITANADGVITSLNVTEDDLFMGGEVAVIQNMNKFIISSRADQYDIGDIEKGLPTKIIVRALGDNGEMEGKLTFVAPTPDVKDLTTAQTIEYPLESEIADPAKGLRLGMNAKLEVICEEKKNVLAVPDDCIQVNDNGDYYVETVDEAGNVTPVTVTYGMKTDYYSEITGSGISEGMQVVMPEQEEEEPNAMILF
ncbi:MAG: HlyD family efflux transporter periplasmic adaptor subunit [Ruminococcus sp.]|nr:HlyD family efflux transporter periplasmic adaptor subunit [Ruminococcus sp.]